MPTSSSTRSASFDSVLDSFSADESYVDHLLSASQEAAMVAFFSQQPVLRLLGKPYMVQSTD